MMALKIPKGDGPAEEAPFTRIVPGFGLDKQLIDASVPSDVPARASILELIANSVSEEPDKRMTLKRSLLLLKEAEAAVLRQLKLEETKVDIAPMINVGAIGSTTDLYRSASHELRQDAQIPKTSTLVS
jgi:hypothetical protein